MSIVVYRINWFRIIQDLNKSGVLDPEIAREIGAPPSSISYYKQGREPLYGTGEKLLALHRKCCLSPDPPDKSPRLA